MLILDCKINLPKSRNQPRQRVALTLPDNVLHLCAARLHYLYNITKHWWHNVYDEMEKVCMPIICSLSKIVTQQKIKTQAAFLKNKD